jgi:integrase
MLAHARQGHRPHIPPNAHATAQAVPILDVVTRYVERLRGRSSYRTACEALRAWSEFCRHDDVVYVHELNFAAQERFIASRQFNRRTGERLSNGTINRYLDVFRSACNDAWRRSELVAVPFVRLLPKPAPRDRFFSEDDVRKLLSACHEPHLYRFCMIALHTLQRPSAILQLRTSQVDLANNRIDFLPPGTYQSNKRRPIVPITQTLRPVLEAALTDSQSGYVIEYLGRPVGKLRTSFRAACKRAGIMAAGPGILRHTGATHLAAAAVPIREISGMLGHTTSMITEIVYAKRRPEFLAGAVSELDRLFPRPHEHSASEKHNRIVDAERSFWLTSS